jgi:hypothetical protein
VNAAPGLARGGFVTARNAVLELGPAELLDSLIIRPAASFAGMTFIPDLLAGITPHGVTTGRSLHGLTPRAHGVRPPASHRSLADRRHGGGRA